MSAEYLYKYSHARRMWQADDHITQEVADAALMARFTIVPQSEEERTYVNPRLYFSREGQMGRESMNVVTIPRKDREAMRVLLRVFHVWKGLAATLPWAELTEWLKAEHAEEEEKHQLLAQTYSGLRGLAVAAFRTIWATIKRCDKAKLRPVETAKKRRLDVYLPELY